MVSPPRDDEPGAWHHVTNRGVGRRTVFENRADVAYFLSRVARAVRSGRIEVHAFSCLTTHFHLLVRSPKGRLPDAMNQVLSPYVLWFNGRRDRDGPLFKRRYLASRVDDDTYRAAVIRYIDFNAVGAGMVGQPSDHPYGSAQYYVGKRKAPPWLTCDAVQEWVSRVAGVPFSGEAYRSVFEHPLTAGERWLVDRQLSGKRLDGGGLHEMITALPPDLRRGFAEQTRNADGTAPWRRFIAPHTVMAAVEALQREDREWTVQPGRCGKPAWILMACSLLRVVCRLSYEETSQWVGVAAATALRYHRDHRVLLEKDDRYAARVAAVIAQIAATAPGAIGFPGQAVAQWKELPLGRSVQVEGIAPGAIRFRGDPFQGGGPGAVRGPDRPAPRSREPFPGTVGQNEAN